MERALHHLDAAAADVGCNDGAVALDLPVALHRPRARDPQVAALQARILAEV